MMTPEDEKNLADLMRGLAWASVACASCVCITFLVFREKRQSLGQILTFCFCLSSLGLSVGLLIPSFSSTQHVFTTPSLCKTQAWLIQFWGSGCIIFWALITANLYRMVVFRSRGPLVATLGLPRGADSLDWVFSWPVQVGVGVAYMLGMSLSPLAAGAYGPHGFFCWFDADDWNWVFGGLYAEMGVLLVLGMGMWIRIILVVRRLHASSARRAISSPLLSSPKASFSPSPHASFASLPSPLPMASTRTSSALSGASASASASASAAPPAPTMFRHIAFVMVFFSVFSTMLTNELYMRFSHKQSYVLWTCHVIALGGIGVSTLITCGLTSMNARLWTSALKSLRAKAAGGDG